MFFVIYCHDASKQKKIKVHKPLLGDLLDSVATDMVMYILMGGLTILGNVFLLNYANKISTAIKTNDQATLNSGFAGLRNYCAFWAIIMIIGLLFMLIVLASAMSSM